MLKKNHLNNFGELKNKFAAAIYRLRRYLE